ncbi:MAG TPA: hypothetical protein VFB63_35035, partial [Bryobacteraceae bacterium]|nr:hypothetical protein [Bryobacteraceae bacterium]
MRWTMIVALFATAGTMLWVNGQSPRDGTLVWEFATIESLQEGWIGNTKTTSANICYQASNGCRWILFELNAWDRSTMPLPQRWRGWVGLAGSRSLDAGRPKNRPSVLMKREFSAELRKQHRIKK